MTNPTNPSKITSVGTSDEAQGITIRPDGNYVYVIARYNGSVDVISTTAYTKIATISIGTGGIDFSGSRGIVVSPNGQYVYAAHSYDKTVSIIRTSDNTKIDTFNVGADIWDMRMTSDGAYILATGIGTRNIIAIKTADKTVRTLHQGTTSNTFLGIDLSSDGNFMLITDANQKKVLLFSNTLKGY
ncbi:MAG: YncE family protein [Planctomycetota bacterium]